MPAERRVFFAVSNIGILNFLVEFALCLWRTFIVHFFFV